MSDRPIDGFGSYSQYAVANESLARQPGIQDEIGNFLRSELLKQQDQINHQEEEMLLRFFGSFEMAKQWGHLFVVEQVESPLTPTPSDAIPETTVYRLEVSYRLRMKTPEEILGPYAGVFMTKNRYWSPKTNPKDGE